MVGCKNGLKSLQSIPVCILLYSDFATFPIKVQSPCFQSLNLSLAITYFDQWDVGKCDTSRCLELTCSKTCVHCSLSCFSSASFLLIKQQCLVVQHIKSSNIYTTSLSVIGLFSVGRFITIMSPKGWLGLGTFKKWVVLASPRLGPLAPSGFGCGWLAHKSPAFEQVVSRWR